ncbi:tetratricopeptide repeat protein [Anabaena sp. UHCC 0451]|uniref:tetratricopeptide repeat protein n=1 Tax=Anabaena sp. UHCC 0451 TaxID=2055235 RepID=UPI002B1F6478|nr:tetratricopeptide repeat protein [Anabaena sp. UHCC 0451]MEA5578491.1 tetratricopeptide repeat protein [Anabaena sp. UHCC 0451]
MISDSSTNQNLPIANPVEINFNLASIWLGKGQIERAIAGYRKVLELQPDHLQAAIHLSHLEERRKWSKVVSSDALIDNPDGKLNLNGQKLIVVHRCGWSFALHALKPLHNSQGILFDGFLESTFFWQEQRTGKIQEPYTQPWVGFLHNPPKMPTSLFSHGSPEFLFKKDNWQKSLESCVGLFTLSEYYAQWLRKQTDCPVSSLIYPTEIPELQFNFERFVERSDKKIIQLGWWLRRLTAIYQLPIARENALGYEKIKLNSAFAPDSDDQLQQLTERQIELENIRFDSLFLENTRDVTHVSNQEYDRLLSENIGFIHLYNASANTAVIECIARATPLLVNPLPPVVEYLGEEYPFYFHTLEEAAEKAMDLELIRQTHDYLNHCETRSKISAEYFLESFRNSEVYQRVMELY